MVQMFINRGDKKLSAARKRELEKAKRILQRKNDALPEMFPALFVDERRHPTLRKLSTMLLCEVENAGMIPQTMPISADNPVP